MKNECLRPRPNPNDADAWDGSAVRRRVTGELGLVIKHFPASEYRPPYVWVRWSSGEIECVGLYMVDCVYFPWYYRKAA